ncbi:MAG TPA: universal stress protein [Phycisphaerales bacterium]|nr:universal stress protein [Phycisphaerales bacterium]
MYRTILVPLENSAADEAILSHIRSLAKLLGSKLVLIHVADGHVARNQSQLNLEDSEEMRVDRAYLERRTAELSGDGYQVSWKLAAGDPAREITQAAEREGADLIAMSTHGHRLVMDVLLGSVASEVRHRSRVPVLLVRASA